MQDFRHPKYLAWESVVVLLRPDTIGSGAEEQDEGGLLMNQIECSGIEGLQLPGQLSLGDGNSRVSGIEASVDKRWELGCEGSSAALPMQSSMSPGL